MEIPRGLFHVERQYDTGGEVLIMDGVDYSKPDTIDILHIADCFARMGCKVMAPVPIHFKSDLYPIVFGGLMGTRYERKCPDLVIDGKYFEYESYVRPWNKRKLSNMLSDGLRQSSRLILDNRDGTSVRQILRAIHARLNVNANIDEIWIYDGDSVVDIYP